MADECDWMNQLGGKFGAKWVCGKKSTESAGGGPSLCCPRLPPRRSRDDGQHPRARARARGCSIFVVGRLFESSAGVGYDFSFFSGSNSYEPAWVHLQVFFFVMNSSRPLCCTWHWLYCEHQHAFFRTVDHAVALVYLTFFGPVSEHQRLVKSGCW